MRSLKSGLAFLLAVALFAPLAFAQPMPFTSTGTGIPDKRTLRTVQASRLTYRASTVSKSATVAGTGVFFSFCGSSTKTVRLTRLTITGTVATAAVYADVVLSKTSTATSGGAGVASLSKVPMDSASAAATASTVSYYTTGLATAGTLVGTIGAQQFFAPITGTPALGPGMVSWDWSDRVDSEAPTLRGTAQCFVAAFGTTTTNVPTLTVEITWTEATDPQ